MVPYVPWFRVPEDPHNGPGIGLLDNVCGLGCDIKFECAMWVWFLSKNDHSFEKPQMEIAELRSVISMYREEKSNLSARVQEQQSTIQKQGIAIRDLSKKMEEHKRVFEQALHEKEQEFKELLVSYDTLSTKLKKYDESWIKDSQYLIPSWKVDRSVVQQISQQYLGVGAWGVLYSGEFNNERVAIKYAHRDYYKFQAQLR